MCSAAKWAGGLSPLARGNRLTVRAPEAVQGPIPARAGQPSSCVSLLAGQRAYPRSRGATATAPHGHPATGGLSPLARGNPISHALAWSQAGPIPARAGQPRWGDGRGGFYRAYPRSRGATGWHPLFWGRGGGLSPLARGNQHARKPRVISPGPIPARAGQPSTTLHGSLAIRAYPRSRGATAIKNSLRLAQSGLSPLARGNLLHATCCRAKGIPEMDTKF